MQGEITINILYLHSHDSGRYIEPYGHKIATPNLMNFATESTLFRNAYCAGPTCSPSRAALLTGSSPHSCGMFGLAHRGFEMDDYSKHIVHFLNTYNYETVLCGIQHEAPESEILEYDKVITVDDRDMGDGNSFNSKTWDLSNAAIAADYIKDAKNPFFLSVGLFNTHRKFPPIADYINQDYIDVPSPLPDCQEIRQDMAGYITSAGIMDTCVGIILDAIKESGKEDETIIIFTTDHGIAFPLMKCNLFDDGIGVSLLIKYPGNKLAGKSVNSLISQIDIFPTLCDLLAIEKPDYLEGKSLMPIFNGEQDEINEEVFSEITYHAAYEPMRCIRTKRYKLIKNFSDQGSYMPANIDEGLSKEYFLQRGLLKRDKDKVLLFDLCFDPNEKNNLANNANYSKIKEDLDKKLFSWMAKTKDPLLKGIIAIPAGAKVNKQSCINASEKDYV